MSEKTEAQKAQIIFDDVFGKGHGKDATIQRMIDVLEITGYKANIYLNYFRTGARKD